MRTGKLHTIYSLYVDMFAAGLLAAVLAPPLFGQTIPARRTPALVGQPLATAAQALRLLDLHSESGVFYISAQNWRDTLQPGVVQMQSPQPDIPVPLGAPVAVWTFRKADSEQKIVRTPDLKGKTAAETAKLLAQAGLASMRADGSIPPAGDDIAVDQYPRAGQAVYEKTSVHVRYRTK